jgi:putative lipase involved disintegration of autophagic bodies
MISGMNLNNARIFLYRGSCDLRRSFDRLALMVTEELHEDPLKGDWFVFLNVNKTKLKVLYWDNDGYARFVIPNDGNILDRAAWANLLEGIEANVIKRQPRYRRDNCKIS